MGSTTLDINVYSNLPRHSHVTVPEEIWEHVGTRSSGGEHPETMVSGWFRHPSCSHVFPRVHGNRLLIRGSRVRAPDRPPIEFAPHNSSLCGPVTGCSDRSGRGPACGRPRSCSHRRSCLANTNGISDFFGSRAIVFRRDAKRNLRGGVSVGQIRHRQAVAWSLPESNR